MQFISQGSALVTQNVNLARKRMFLMPASVAKINASDDITSIMGKLDKARSFSHSLKSDGTLLCTRAAGWSGSKYYHALVGPMRYSWASDYSDGSTTYLDMTSTTYSLTDTFRRMYSLGSAANGQKFIADTGSLLDTQAAQFEAETDSSLLFPTMLLPPFEGTVSDGNIYSISDDPMTNTTVNSGNIGTTGQYENRSGNYVQSWVQTAKTATTDTRLGSIYGLNNLAAGTEFMLANQAVGIASAARILYANIWTSAGTRYYSGGGWIYSYNRIKLLNVAKSQETRRMYSKGTSQPDTANYALSWAVMPVYLPDSTVLMQIADFGSDLIQTGLSQVAVRPQVKSNIADVPARPQVFSM